MPQTTRVWNDRSQSTTDVARRRNCNEKLYKAGTRSSVTLAAQNADRRAAVSEIELALSTLSGLSIFQKADVRRRKSGSSTPNVGAHQRRPLQPFCEQARRAASPHQRDRPRPLCLVETWPGEPYRPHDNVIMIRRRRFARTICRTTF